MTLIEPNVMLITEKDPAKKIELAGRTCYKSEDKITSNSAEKFMKMLISRNHLAMTEHAIFCFEYDTDNAEDAYCVYKILKNISRFAYTTVTQVKKQCYRVLYSANMRVLIENNIIYDDEYSLYDFNFSQYGVALDLINFEEDIKDKTDEEIKNHRFTTMRFITDRGVTHEIVRHRPCSFAQESTRYVKYNNNNMQFIKPTDYDSWEPGVKGLFLNSCNEAETNYCALMNRGLTAQQARAVLPNAIKTEIVVTANDEEWHHIFDLRCDKAAHPDMRKIANMAQLIYWNTYPEVQGVVEFVPESI